MANINMFLNKIKTEKLAFDVRNAIHDAIKQCYTDGTKKGNINMEIIQARGKYNSLNERLNDMEVK